MSWIDDVASWLKVDLKTPFDQLPKKFGPENRISLVSGNVRRAGNNSLIRLYHQPVPRTVRGPNNVHICL